MSEPDFTPKDILDKMAIDRSDYRFVAERNELRREWMKRQQREIFKIFLGVKCCGERHRQTDNTSDYNIGSRSEGTLDWCYCHCSICEDENNPMSWNYKNPLFDNINPDEIKVVYFYPKSLVMQ